MTEGFSSSSPARSHRLRHHRRYLKHLVITYLLVTPLALYVTSTAPHRGDYPFPMEFILWHAVSCAALIVSGRLLLSTLELFNCKRRLRIRAEFFFKLLSVWPALVLMTMTVLKIVGAA